MYDKIKIGAKADAHVERSASLVEKILMSSNWEWEHWRDGKLIDEWIDTNVCTLEGLDHILGSGFAGVTQITDWYVIIYNTDTTPVSSMTYAVPVFTETTMYSEANRPEWQDAGVSSQVITNSANKASFTMSTAETIYGAGLVGGGTGDNTKGDTAGGGVLYNVSDFSTGSKVVASNDILKVTIQLTIADA
jgi:hypothetical protein